METNIQLQLEGTIQTKPALVWTIVISIVVMHIKIKN